MSVVPIDIILVNLWCVWMYEIWVFDTDAIEEVLELYLVKGDCVCTTVTGLWFMNCVLWFVLFAVTVTLAGVQLSGTSEKIICVTRLNLLQDLLEASRGLCGEKMSHTSIDRFKVGQHTVLTPNHAQCHIEIECSWNIYNPVDF